MLIPLVVFFIFFLLFLSSVTVNMLNHHPESRRTKRNVLTGDDKDKQSFSFRTVVPMNPLHGPRSTFGVAASATVECLEDELPLRVLTAENDNETVCADARCVNDPDYFEIHCTSSPFQLQQVLAHAQTVLLRCNADSKRLVTDSRDEVLEERLSKDYVFATPGVYVETFLPTRLYSRAWDDIEKRWYVKTLFPKSVTDLPDHCDCGDKENSVQIAKLRVSCDRFRGLLSFCRFSIHAHIRAGEVAVCCNRLCSRPEPLTTCELTTIRAAARREPYYTCSWLEKEILFKWNVGANRFDPYWRFEFAIGIYSDLQDRFIADAFALFAFNRWKTPDESVTNADEIYFNSPINVAGYKWYEPSSLDEENERRFESLRGRGIYSGDKHDWISLRIAKDRLNLTSLPEDVLLSSTLIRTCTLSEGREVREEHR